MCINIYFTFLFKFDLFFYFFLNKINDKIDIMLQLDIICNFDKITNN